MHNGFLSSLYPMMKNVASFLSYGDASDIIIIILWMSISPIAIRLLKESMPNFQEYFHHFWFHNSEEIIFFTRCNIIVYASLVLTQNKLLLWWDNPLNFPIFSAIFSNSFIIYHSCFCILLPFLYLLHTFSSMYFLHISICHFFLIHIIPLQRSPGVNCSLSLIFSSYHHISITITNCFLSL